MPDSAYPGIQTLCRGRLVGPLDVPSDPIGGGGRMVEPWIRGEGGAGGAEERGT